MADLENLERRLDDMEHRLDDVLSQRILREAGGEPEAARRSRSSTTRILLGVLIVVLGLVWMGKSLGVEWLQQIEFWPIAVIAIGLFIIFGDR